MNEKSLRLAISYWEGYRWLHIRRQSGVEAFHYIEPRSIEQCLALARDYEPLPEELVVADHTATLFVGHPAEPLDESWRNAPDYPNSLADCFRIQKALDRHQRGWFIDALREILNERHRENPRWYGPETFDYANVGAADRAAALFVALKLPEMLSRKQLSEFCLQNQDSSTQLRRPTR